MAKPNKVVARNDDAVSRQLVERMLMDTWFEFRIGGRWHSVQEFGQHLVDHYPQASWTEHRAVLHVVAQNAQRMSEQLAALSRALSEV